MPPHNALSFEYIDIQVIFTIIISYDYIIRYGYSKYVYYVFSIIKASVIKS